MAPMGSRIAPVWRLTEKQEVSPPAPCDGWAGVRGRGAASACCAVPRHGLPVPLSDPRDRGDVCLVRGCAEEDLVRSSLEEGVVVMGRELQKLSLHLAKLFH